MTATHDQDSTLPAAPVLYCALELGWNTWKLAFTIGAGQKPRIRTIRARALDVLLAEIEAAKARFGLPGAAKVVSCYEAGRDGFWLDRFLGTHDVENIVVDSASIEVNRRKRRAKSDRLDAVKLVSMLMRWHNGEKKVWSVVRPPSAEDEDHIFAASDFNFGSVDSILSVTINASGITSGTLFASRKLPLRAYLMAVAIFCNEVKGKSMLALSRDLGLSYKSAFVLAHKLREAMAEEMKGRTIGDDKPEAEVDGGHFGGYVKPANMKAHRVDRRFGEHQSGRDRARAQWQIRCRPYSARKGKRCHSSRRGSRPAPWSTPTKPAPGTIFMAASK